MATQPTKVERRRSRQIGGREGLADAADRVK